MTSPSLVQIVVCKERCQNVFLHYFIHETHRLCFIFFVPFVRTPLFCNFIFLFSPLIIFPVISFFFFFFFYGSLLISSYFFFGKMCEIEVSSLFFSILLIHFTRSTSVYIFIFSFLSWPHIINHTSSHHKFSVAPIVTPFPALFTTNMQDVTLTNTRSLLITFHSSACGTLITLLSIPHSLASRVHSWSPSFFEAPGYYRKTRMTLTFWYKSGTSTVAANTHPCQILNLQSCGRVLPFCHIMSHKLQKL